MLDFSDSDVQGALERQYKDRFGKVSLKELEEKVAAGTIQPRVPEQSHKGKAKEAGLFTRMTEGLKLYKVVPGGMSRDQATLWAGELYLRIVESEKVDEKSLLQLADRRSLAVASHLEKTVLVPKNRLGGKDPEPLSGDALPAASLSLDAL
jgi:hypothetical protein